MRYRAGVAQAERIMIDSEDNKEYLPIEGLADFNKATAELLLGANNAAIYEVTHNPSRAVQYTFCSTRKMAPASSGLHRCYAVGVCVLSMRSGMLSMSCRVEIKWLCTLRLCPVASANTLCGRCWCTYAHIARDAIVLSQTSS